MYGCRCCVAFRSKDDEEPSPDPWAPEARSDLTMGSDDDDADLLEDIYPKGSLKNSPAF